VHLVAGLVLVAVESEVPDLAVVQFGHVGSTVQAEVAAAAVLTAG